MILVVLVILALFVVPRRFPGKPPKLPIGKAP